MIPHGPSSGGGKTCRSRPGRDEPVYAREVSGFLARSLATTACLALLAGGATLAIAAKGGRSGSPTPAHIQYSDKPGAQGCTPGYWKNHTGVWVSYGPSQLYDDVFGVSYSPTLTLGGALEQGGGGFAALGRHSTAALLGAAHPDVNYGLTTSEIIAAVRQAFASGTPEPLKDRLDGLNNAGCSIDAHGRPVD